MPSNANASSSAHTIQPTKEEDHQIHKLFIIFNGITLSFLQIKFQISKTSPFDDSHYPFIISFFVFTLVYFFFCLPEFKLRHVRELQKLVANISHLFGAIATILLFSILSPVFALCLLPFTAVWFAAIGYGFYSQFSKSKSPPGSADHINSQA